MRSWIAVCVNEKLKDFMIKKIKKNSINEKKLIKISDKSMISLESPNYGFINEKLHNWKKNQKKKSNKE